MEVGKAVLALNLVDPELDLAEGMVLILLEISEGNFECNVTRASCTNDQTKVQQNAVTSNI